MNVSQAILQARELVSVSVAFGNPAAMEVVAKPDGTHDVQPHGMQARTGRKGHRVVHVEPVPAEARHMIK